MRGYYKGTASVITGSQLTFWFCFPIFKVRILIFVLGHVEMEVMALAGIWDLKHFALWKCHLPFGNIHGVSLYICIK